MVGKGTPMKIQTAIAAVMLSAAGTVLAAPEAKAPRDPEMINIQGFQKILEQNHGKPLLVNFWATWCEPCRDEYPMLNELAKQYAPKGLQVVGVSMDDDGDFWRDTNQFSRITERLLGLRRRSGNPSSRDGQGRCRCPSFMRGMGGKWPTLLARRAGNSTKKRFARCSATAEALERPESSHPSLKQKVIEELRMLD